MARMRKFTPVGNVQPDLNITPLVDVVLVLLIIFMLVAPRIDQDVPVDLPAVANPDPDSEAALDPLKLTVVDAGAYYIDGRPYDLDGAVAYLTTAHAQQPGRRLALRADAKLPYREVREVFARCQRLGFPGMSLLVGQRRDAPAPLPDGGDQRS